MKLQRFKIESLQHDYDGKEKLSVYSVLATNETDARIMVYMAHGTFLNFFMRVIDEHDIELAMKFTRVLHE